MCVIVYKDYITFADEEISSFIVGDKKDCKDLDDIKKTFELKNPIMLCKEIKDFSVFKTDNILIFDLCISKLVDDLPLIKLLPLMDNLSIAKHAIRNKLRTFIDSIEKNKHSWIQLASKKEFSLYKLVKRKWPISHNKSNEGWKKDAKDIGLIDRIYPGIQETKLKRKKNRDKYFGEIKQTTNYGKFKYFNTPKNKLYEDIFLNISDDKMAMEYLLACMISKKYFHHILTPRVFSKLNNILAENPRLDKIVKYAMKYMFYMLLKIERLNGKNTDKDSPCIMEEDIFRELPIFQGELDTQPYFTEIYNDKRYGNSREELLMYPDGKRSFVDHNTFLSRLDIVSDGLLTKVDLGKHDAFLTGSSLVPCIAINPLEKNYDTFQDYINYYYPNYALCEEKDDGIVNFIKNKAEYTNITKKQCLENLPDIIDEEDDRKLTAMHDDLIRKQSKLSDMDIAVRADNHLEYQKKVFALVSDIKKSLPKEKADKLYLQKYKLKYGYKWILKGAKRHMEFFRINLEAQQLLHSFHVNVVKFWWDGKIIRGRVSGICAVLTGVNQWYKIIFNNKNPIDIIMKYMQRGYTTLLNREEIKFLKLYIGKNEKYANIKDTIFIGKAHRTHILYTGNDGIRHGLPVIDLDIEHFNSPLHWGNNYFNIKRIGLNTIFSMNGKIIIPKNMCLRAAIDDLMD